MTLAEIVLALAGVVGIYFLLRPLQRRLERYLVSRLARGRRGQPPTIDITEFTSRRAHHQKEDEQP